MIKLRQPYFDLSPAVYKPMLQALKGLESSSLGNTIIELVYLRVSQINGCAYCLEMHSQSLRRAGVEQAKMDALAGWKVSNHFSDKERAALTWAEAVTLIYESGAKDDVYRPLQDFFNAQEISDLSFAISLMNAFNRLAISMRI